MVNAEELESGLTWPDRCEMPDLSELSSASSIDSALNRMFSGGGSKDPVSHALQINFNRMVDMLVENYEAARRYQTIASTRDGSVPLHALITAIGLFENCITTALRAISFARRLKNHTRGRMISKQSVLSDSVGDRIRELRNAIEHLDRDLASGNWVKWHAYCLIPKEDHIILGEQRIDYLELAGWITQLHGIAQETAQYKESQDETKLD